MDIWDRESGLFGGKTDSILTCQKRQKQVKTFFISRDLVYYYYSIFSFVWYTKLAFSEYFFAVFFRFDMLVYHWHFRGLFRTTTQEIGCSMEQWIWLDEIGFPLYEISNEGRVRNINTRKIVSPLTNQSGIVQVNLYTPSGKRQGFSVARLVADQFGLERLRETYDTITYLDGDRTNVKLDNLVWRPRWFAIKYHKQIDRPGLRFPIILTQTGEVFAKPMDAAMKYGLIEIDVVMSITNSGYERGVFPSGLKFKRYE